MSSARPSQRGGRGESLGAEDKLRSRGDFTRCYQQGRRRHGAAVTLHVLQNQTGRPRLGITVTRKVGGAVVRVRLKRRIREIYRRWNKRHLLPAVDIVAHVKRGASRASFQDFKMELEKLLSTIVPPAH